MVLTLQVAVVYAWARNVVIIAAAGNGGSDRIGDSAPECPGNCNHVVSVTATDQNDQRASFSNFGLLNNNRQCTERCTSFTGEFLVVTLSAFK